MNITEPGHFHPFKRQRQLSRLYRRLRRAGLIGLMIVVLLISLVYYHYNRQPPELVAELIMPRYYAGAVSLAWPGQASTAIGLLNHGIQATHGAQTPRPTASLAKVMLALAVLEARPLKPGEQGPMIPFGPTDETRYNDYISRGVGAIPVQAGQGISQYQALQAILLSSANNIADSLAVWAYGSIAKYHVAAEKLALRYGMTQTNFAVDASGLDPKNVSSPADIVRLGEVALRQPVIRQIIGQPSAEITGIGTIYNNLTELNGGGFLAIKAGMSDESGGCLLFAADHKLADGQTVTVIATIMGAVDWPAAARAATPLLDSIRQAFGPITVLKPRQVIARYNLPWGEPVAAVTTGSAVVTSWKATKPKMVLDLDKLRAPQAAGTRVGLATVESPVNKVSVPIVLEKPIPKPPSSWRWRL